MKKIALALAVVSASLFSCKKETTQTTEVKDTTTTTETVTTTETAEPVAMDSAAMMKAWMEYATPGDMHKMLAADTGKWTAEMKMWMDPAGPPSVNTSTADISMVLGGRYQMAKYKGTVDGQPFEGVATVGYNNASKKFESTWQDNMGTGTMYVEGDYDAASKTVKFEGEMMDPMMKKMKKFRENFTIVDANTRKMEMFDTDPSGKEYKSMEITLKRK